MYKGASESLQRRHAVDKPHPSRGYIDGASDARDVLPAPSTMTAGQLKTEQAQLRLEMQKIEQELAVAKAVRNERAITAIGQRKMVHQTRLGAINDVLRERNANHDLARLSQAVSDVCDEETRAAIYARARELRDAYAASGIETEGHDPAEGHGAEHESAVASGETPRDTHS